MRVGPLYIRGVNLWRLTPALAMLLGVSFPGPKIIPRALYKVPLRHLPTPPAPPFLGFLAPFFNFFKKFFARLPRPCPPCAESPCRVLAQTRTPEFRGRTAHSRLAAVPKSPAKHRPGTPKYPTLTPLRIKKLSKVRSTLLTPLPGECILEYMRLKEPRRPPHTGRHAQHRPPPKISN